MHVEHDSFLFSELVVSVTSMESFLVIKQTD